MRKRTRRWRRRHVEGEAAKGNAEASLLLREWK